MKEFMTGLYANENFPIYLAAIILALLVAFFVIYFLGKKDQKKIEMTQRLEAINPNAFANVNGPVAVEAPVQQMVQPQPAVSYAQPVQQVQAPAPVASPVPQMQQVMQPVQMQAPVAPVVQNQIPVEQVVPVYPQAVEPQVVVSPAPEMPIVETPVQPVQYAETTYEPAPMVEPQVEMPVEQPVPVVEQPIQEPLVTVEPTPEVVVPEVPKFNPEPVIEPYIPEANIEGYQNLANSISNELAELERQQEIAKPIIEGSNIENKVTDNPTKVMTGVFSSVYAPKKDETAFEETMEIELPKLKSAPVLDEETEPSIKL